MKTDITENVGKHQFELAGLGSAPFKFVGFGENVITYPDGTTKAGGSCDFCSTGIRLECHIVSSDGKRSKVGCNCIEKIGDKGLLKAYKASPEFRAHQNKLRQQKAAKVNLELVQIINKNQEKLRLMPHPLGFVDRVTGLDLNAYDWADYMAYACGNSGRENLLKRLKKMLNE